MKHLFFLIAVVLTLASCSKNAERDLAAVDPGQDSKIEFKFDGNLKQYFTVSAGVAHVTGVNVYSFVGVKNPTNDNIFQLVFMTDSLRPGTYNVNTGIVAFREANTVATNISSTDFTVTITSNVNGLVNGSFKGTVYNQTASHNSTILEGLIQNIQLIY